MPPPMDDLEDMRKYANALVILYTRQAEKHANDLASGKINLAQFHAEMRGLLKECHKMMFITGYGGNKADIDMNEFAKLGSVMRKQYDFLRQLMKAIMQADRDGRSLDFVKNRVGMFVRSSRATFWNAAVGFNIPQVPADGSTKCKSNCKCYLKIDYERDAVGNKQTALVYWKLRPAEHCSDCRQLAREWSPKRFDVTGARRTQSIKIYLSQLQRDPSPDELYLLLGALA